MIFNGKALMLYEPIENMLGAKVTHNGVTHGLGEGGYDIRIQQDVTFRRDLFLRRCVDRRENATYDTKYDREYPDDHFLKPMVQVTVPGRFVLASSLERFQMPTNMLGIVHDKSSWARKGLSVFNTVIEPGWKGYLTLELVYHGWKDLHIPAGSGIAQVIFHETREHSQYDGRYQNQVKLPVEAIQATDSCV